MYVCMYVCTCVCECLFVETAIGLKDFSCLPIFCWEICDNIAATKRYRCRQFVLSMHVKRYVCSRYTYMYMCVCVCILLHNLNAFVCIYVCIYVCRYVYKTSLYYNSLKQLQYFIYLIFR